jgi:polar amino acid transport system substrate-binding protein
MFMSRKTKMVLAVLVLAGALFTLIVVAFPPAPQRLVIGYAEEPPYAFALENGTVTGESPEVAKAIAARLGITNVEWRLVEFGDLIDELEAGSIDLVAAGMFITPERAGRVAFSEPTFHVRPGLLVARGNPADLHAYADVIARSRVRTAALHGSVEEELLRRMGLAEGRLFLVPDALTGRVAVESGLAQCLALSLPTLRWMEQRDVEGKIEVARPFAVPDDPAIQRLGYGGFAFRRNDRERLRAWNAELSEYIGSREHLELVSGFGFTAEDLPGSMTTREVLAQ